MPPAIPQPLALGRFKRLPQRASEVWQGGIVRLPMWVENPADPSAPPYRPSGAIWLSLRTGLLHLDLPEDGKEVTPELALATLLELGLRHAKELEGRPSRVETNDPALRDALAAPLAALDTAVTVVDDMPAVREALRDLEAHTAGVLVPGLLESPGMSVDRLRAFASAAAQFFAARPWQHLGNDDLVVVESARAPREMRHVSVLGHGGYQYGVAFFASRREFERLLEQADAPDTATRAHGVTFGPIDDLPFADVDAWQDHGLPVAGERAYPLAADQRSNGSVHRPDPPALSFIEGLLRALAETTEDELDAGAWAKRVDTVDGPLELRLSLPDLLEAESGRRPSRPPATTTSIADDREGARIARVATELAGLPGREPTPLERAQQLAYDAMEANGRLRIKYARQALAISPECADAWVVLAEEASTADSALERYQRGVEAGAAAIGTEDFAAARGLFWTVLQTRPYMRARLGLAAALRDLGRDDEAIAHYRALLDLNPEDDQGARYLLLEVLLERGLNDDAGRLLAEYQHDTQAQWLFGRVLWRFRTDGDTEAARAALGAASRANPHVVRYLIDPDALPDQVAPVFELGSREEAGNVVDALLESFEATDGALEWLRAQARGRRSKPGGRRRGR
jgi:tetratricopeptide (TPR) repeat protein